MRPPAIILTLFLALATVAAAPATRPTSQPDSPQGFINDLTAPDPATRDRAADRLSSMGAEAESALLAATRDPRPEVRRRASQILLHLPWTDPLDNPKLRTILTTYGDLDASDRSDAVLAIGDSGVDPSSIAGALVRLLRREPSSTVRWAIVRQLLRISDDPAVRPALLPLGDAEDADAPRLYLSGVAWLDEGPTKAAALFQRALGLEAVQPTDTQGQMNGAYEWLAHRAISAGQYTAAAQILRQWGRLDNANTDLNAVEPDALPESAGMLLGLHAQHGPLPGFAKDLQDLSPFRAHPEMLYAIAFILSKAQHPIVAWEYELTAIAAGGFSPLSHQSAGNYLSSQGWTAWASRELHLAILLDNTPSHAVAIDCYLQLSTIASEQGNDLSAARNMEEALTIHSRSDGGDMFESDHFGHVVPSPLTDMWARVHWHYLRTARDRGDLPEMQIRIVRLLELNKAAQVVNNDPDLAIDMVPALRQLGQSQQAHALFESVYASEHQKVLDDPTDAGAKNNVAWLCARCDEHLTEALDLAGAAIKQTPDSSAYLDTAAEANFHLGHVKQAVQLESRALQLTPDDTFMTGQLQRFKSALKSATQP